MYHHDLRAAERRAFEQQLVTHHNIRVHVAVLDMNHRRLGHISHDLLSGQVDVTRGGARSVNLTFTDRHKLISFGSDTPSDGALFANRMLHVTYGVHVDHPALTGWVDIPVFTGPVRTLARKDGNVTVTAQGKETLLKGKAWRPKTLKRGMLKTDAIREILEFYAGETRFDFPDLKARLPHDIPIGRDTIPWHPAHRIAHSMNRQLFYDGRGWSKLRRLPHHPVFTFRDGTGGTIVEPPDVTFDMSDVRNVVWVRGGKHKGRKHRVHYAAVAPKAHPFSPWKLGPDDSPLYLPDTVENKHVHTHAEAQDLAERLLEDRLREHLDIKLSTLVIPHLEGGDLVRADLADGDVDLQFRLGSFSIPLAAGDLMSVGFHKKISVHSHHHGRHHRRRHPR